MRELRVNDNAIRTGASTQAPDGQIGILNQAPKMKSLNEATEINSQNKTTVSTKLMTSPTYNTVNTCHKNLDSSKNKEMIRHSTTCFCTFHTVSLLLYISMTQILTVNTQISVTTVDYLHQSLCLAPLVQPCLSQLVGLQTTNHTLLPVTQSTS